MINSNSLYVCVTYTAAYEILYVCNTLKLRKKKHNSRNISRTSMKLMNLENSANRSGHMIVSPLKSV